MIITIECFDEFRAEPPNRAQRAIVSRLKGELAGFARHLLSQNEVSGGDWLRLAELVGGDPDSVDEISSLGLVKKIKHQASLGSDEACEALVSFHTYSLLQNPTLGLVDDKSRVRPYYVRFGEQAAILLHPVDPSFEVGAKPNFEVGFRLWGASLVLSRQICQGMYNLKNKSVLELGSGLGLCGLVAAQVSGCKELILTDFHAGVVQNAQFNADLNQMSHKVQTCVLDWEEHCDESDGIMHPDRKFDVILGSDVVCQPQDCEALAKVLTQRLVDPGGVGIFCLGVENSRFGVERFSQVLQDAGLAVELSGEESGNLDPWVETSQGIDLDAVVGKATGYKTFLVTS